MTRADSSNSGLGGTVVIVMASLTLALANVPPCAVTAFDTVGEPKLKLVK
jgi:hypothetical protein